MLALATLRPATVACVRITLVERPGRQPTGSFRVLGGSGAAARLAARGTFTFTPGPRTPSSLAGRVTARFVGARRVPAACAGLR